MEYVVIHGSIGGFAIMVKTTLVIMAAGIGSRFGGGIKQLTSFGPCGEIIMDYSIYDAVSAGFDKIVFVIRKDIEEDFRSIIGDRIASKVEVAYAFQEMKDVPEPFTVPEGRKKPWGTGQAILACRGIVNEPFAVINADDYYGKEAFVLIHDYLVKNAGQQRKADGPAYHFCMAGFILKNTLSDNGGVTRGICSLNEQNELTGVEETKNIIKTEEGAAVADAQGSVIRSLDPENLVSMNFWGFTPDFIDYLGRGFAEFLGGLNEGSALTAEYLLPTIVDGMMKKGEADVAVLKSSDRWFGVTYKEDVPSVIHEIRTMVEEGKYPGNLKD